MRRDYLDGEDVGCKMIDVVSGLNTLLVTEKTGPRPRSSSCTVQVHGDSLWGHGVSVESHVGRRRALPGRNCPQISLSRGRWCWRWSSRGHGYWLTHEVDLGHQSVLMPFSVHGRYVWAPFPQWEPLPRRRPGGREWCVAKANWTEYVTEPSQGVYINFWDSGG